MALRVVTQLPQNRVEKVIDEISFTSSIEEKLTPRTKKSLYQRLNRRQLAIVLDDNDLVGWGVIEPLKAGWCELGMTFVKPQYRSTSAFRMLARELVLRKESVIFATYDKKLFDYVRREFGFRESNLKEVLKLAGNTFLLKRLNLEAIKSIRKRYAKQTPIYAVLER